MFLQVIFLIIGFILLIKGADLFVDGASHLARNFKLSKMLIGLTIVAFGTSAPEFAVSVKSMLSGNGEIVLGNVIGSNILNILLILGISSLFHDLRVKNSTVKKELPITLMLSALLIILICDNLFDHTVLNVLTRNDGITIMLFFGVFVYYLISMMRRKVEEEKEDEQVWSILKSILFTIIGILGIVFGSELVVNSATALAKQIGISERMIGLTIIAFGTSLPELVTSIIATKKGEYDIAIGNVVGSNIFNIGIVLGLPILLFGNVEIGSFSSIDLFIFFISTFLLFLFSYNDYKISKKEGMVFLTMFVIYYGFILFV